MTDAPKTATGYTEAEGYAASLRQMAGWITSGDFHDVDETELCAAADFIDRFAGQQRAGVQTGESVNTDLLEACKGAAEWLAGWASAEPYLSRLEGAIARASALSSAAPACTCGGDMAHDYHQDWCPALPSADRRTEACSECQNTGCAAMYEKCDPAKKDYSAASRLSSTNLPREGK